MSSFSDPTDTVTREETRDEIRSRLLMPTASRLTCILDEYVSEFPVDDWDRDGEAIRLLNVLAARYGLDRYIHRIER